MSPRTPLLAALLSATAALRVSSPYGTVQLDAWGDNAIRVRIAPPGSPIVDPPVMPLLPTPPMSGGVRGPASLSQGNLAVAVDGNTGFITATRVSDGTVLLRQTLGKWGAPAPGSRPLAVSATVGFAGLATGERIYGLGEHADGFVARSSFAVTWHLEDNGDVFIPYYTSSVGYAFLWNLPGYGDMNASTASVTWHANATQNVDFWVAVPPAASKNALADLLGEYADAVGHAPQMPAYATGFWQSKNRYRNQSQLLAVAAGYASRGLPLSVIVIDYLSWVTLGDWTFDAACWPDPQAMVDTLRAQGVELMVSFYPYQVVGSSHYNEFMSGGFLNTNLSGGYGTPFGGCLGGTYVYDATSAAARNATFQGWMDGYGRYGIRTAWHDCSEPGRNEALDGKFRYALGTDSEVGSAWTRLHSQMMADGNAAQGYAPSDFVSLSRSFWPGSARLSVAMWSGDIEPTFESLSQQVRVAQSVSLSGVVLWTSDIGGYKGGNASDPAYQELITRWFQFGAFCPVFRLHGKRVGGPPADACGTTNGDNEAWSYGDAATTCIADVIRLRESIRPYVAQISADAAATGMPMLQPLVLAFPDDPAAASPWAEAAFTLGPDWLVSPVTQQGATAWSLYLPALPPGQAWVYHFNASLAFPGGGVNVTVPTPLCEFPLFQRSPPSVVGAAVSPVGSA